MKHFLSKIAAIAVVLTAVVFSAASCSKDNDSGNDIVFPSNHSTSDTTNNPVNPPVNPIGKPTISVLNEEGYVQDGDIVISGEEFNFGFVMASSAETGAALATLVVTVNGVELETLNLEGTEYTYTKTLNLTVDKETRELPTATITAFVTDVRGKTNNATITLSIEQMLVAEVFAWNRHGSNPGTGNLAELGLAWNSNQKDVYAVITPIEGAELYEIPAEKWNEVTTATEKADLFSEDGVALPIRDYRGVSVYYSSTYDDVIATLYNGEYHLIHITESIISSFKGIDATIKGEFK